MSDDLPHDPRTCPMCRALRWSLYTLHALLYLLVVWLTATAWNWWRSA